MAAEVMVPIAGSEDTLVERHGIKVLKENKTGFYAKAWRGKAKRAYAYYHFPTEEARDAWVENELKNAAAREGAKAVKAAHDRVKLEEMRAKIVVGSVFCNSWGYDQTNVDFYEVVRKSVSGATVWVREISSRALPGSSGFMCESVVPVPGEYTSGEIKKVVKAHGLSFGFGGTSLVEDLNAPHYSSWYA